MVWCDVLRLGEVGWGGACEGMHFSQSDNALLLDLIQKVFEVSQKSDSNLKVVS